MPTRSRRCAVSATESPLTDVEALRRLWERLGLQRQLTLTAVAVVAVSMGLSVFLLANLLTRSLTNSLTEQVEGQSRHVASYVSDHGVIGLPGDLDVDTEHQVQVIDHEETVVWASPRTPWTPVTDLRPQPGVTVSEGGERWWGGGDDDDRPVVAATGLESKGKRLVAVTLTQQDEQHEAVSATAALLLSAIPLFMLVSATVTWWLVRQALSTVDQMTSRVAAIDATVGDERVPLPVADDELRHLGTTMNRMLDRMQTAQRNQRSFVSDASHELRSPVASLSGALEIASAADELQTWRELAPLMRAETQRLEKLITGLLSLSRADDSGLTLKLVDVDLDDLATEEVQRLRGVTSKKVLAEISPARVVADASLLGQLLVNLCDNAARHASSAVRVTVHQDEDGGALLRVDDDGHGVPPADRERIFDRFVRLEESRSRDEGGSGLGLAIVSRIVRAHHGTIEVVDSDLGGASFVVHLPATVA